MPQFLADENFRAAIVAGLVRRRREIGRVVTVRIAGLPGASDDVILEWAAQRGMVILTHDRRTMVPIARARVAAGESMPGLVVVPERLSTGRAIDELELMLVCSHAHEWDLQIRNIPI